MSGQRFYRPIRKSIRKLIRDLLLIAPAVIAAAVISNPAAALEVQVLALTRDKAILRIDGTRRVLAAGESSPEGVTLVSATSAEAVVELEGRRETLLLGVVTAPLTAADEADNGDSSVTLWVDGSGFFFADGKINGHPVRFLVDTGSNAVALSSVTANEIGIDYSRGTPGLAETASGIAPMTAIRLNSVSVGGIVLYNVEASVLFGPYPPAPLLGASFLGQLEMNRDGSRMELRKRY
jgi:aspartyl protease family protein